MSCGIHVSTKKSHLSNESNQVNTENMDNTSIKNNNRKKKYLFFKL